MPGHRWPQRNSGRCPGGSPREPACLTWSPSCWGCFVAPEFGRGAERRTFRRRFGLIVSYGLRTRGRGPTASPPATRQSLFANQASAVGHVPSSPLRETMVGNGVESGGSGRGPRYRSFGTGCAPCIGLEPRIRPGRYPASWSPQPGRPVERYFARRRSDGARPTDRPGPPRPPCLGRRHDPGADDARSRPSRRHERASRPACSSPHPTTLCRNSRPEVRHLPRPPAD
jgi:hypothetical protein